MKKILSLVLVVAMVLGSINLIACGGGGEEGAPPTEEEGTPIIGGRLHLIGAGNIANIGDPNQISNPGDAAYTFVACEGLLRFDNEGNLQPWLAREYEIAPDGSSITFYLQEGIKFQDDTPFDADAVKYNIDIQLTTPAWMNLKAFESCQVIDKYTVKMNFKDGKFDWPAFKSLGGFFSCMMFSPTYLRDNTPEYKRTHVVGTGPFKLVEFKRDEYLKFDRFDDYWRGRPYLDGVDYKIIPDPNTQLMAFEAGEVDTLGVQPKDREDLESKGFEVQEMPLTVAINLALIPSSNNPDSPLADINVRRACEYAIDKQALLDTIGYGLGKVTNQIYPDNDPNYNPDVVGYPYNPDKARELLRQAGYEHGLKLKFYQVDFLTSDFPLAIQGMWAEVGIEMELIEISILQINDMVAAGGAGWDGWFYAFAVAGPNVDPASGLINGPINYNTTWCSNYEPEELMDLARAGASELDPEKRVQIYQELAKKMTDEYAQWLWLYCPIGLTSVSPRVKGVDFSQIGSEYPYAFAWVAY